MKIEKLEIRNFGKMQNRTLEFSDGIQLISGENIDTIKRIVLYL